VQVPEKAFVRLLKLGADAVFAPEKFGNQFYELVAQSLYSPIAGLNFSDSVAMSAESSVF
jgi:CRISPR-associated endonuclease/helicase Cas3